MSTVMQQIATQRDSEDAETFFERVASLAAASDQPLRMDFAGPLCGNPMMTPDGHLQIHIDPDSPFDTACASQALALAQKLHTMVQIIQGAEPGQIRLPIRPNMCEEEVMDDYTRAHWQAYAS